MENYIFIGIIALCTIILLVSLVRHRFETLINFILRIAVGIVAIYFFNVILQYKDMNCTVGINGYSILTLGTLGTPGFVLMYAISFYYSLT